MDETADNLTRPKSAGERLETDVDLPNILRGEASTRRFPWTAQTARSRLPKRGWKPVMLCPLLSPRREPSEITSTPVAISQRTAALESPRHPLAFSAVRFVPRSSTSNCSGILVETKAPDLSGLGTELQRTTDRAKCLICLTVFELAQSGGPETSTDLAPA